MLRSLHLTVDLHHLSDILAPLPSTSKHLEDITIEVTGAKGCDVDDLAWILLALTRTMTSLRVSFIYYQGSSHPEFESQALRTLEELQDSLLPRLAGLHGEGRLQFLRCPQTAAEALLDEGR